MKLSTNHLRVNILLIIAMTCIFIVGHSTLFYFYGQSSYQETLWAHLNLFNLEGFNVFDHALYQPPLLFLNFSLLWSFLNFKISTQSPFFISLTIFTFFLLLNSHSIQSLASRKKILYLFSVLALTLNPWSTYLVFQNPMWLILISLLFTFISGIHLSPNSGQIRGILLCALSFLALLLAGTNGNILFLSLLIFLPIFLKNKTGDNPVFSTLLAYLFPSIMTFSSVAYLAWLKKLSIMNLLFDREVIFSWQITHSSFLFIPLILLSYFPKRDRRGNDIAFSHVHTVLMIFSLLLAFSGFNLKTETLLGLISIVIALKFIFQVSHHKADLIKVFYILSLSIYFFQTRSNSSFLPMNNLSEKSIEKEKVSAWLGANPKEKTLVLAQSLELKDFDLNDSSDIPKRIIVEYIEEDYLERLDLKKQRHLFLYGHNEYELVFEGNHYRIYQENSIPVFPVDNKPEYFLFLSYFKSLKSDIILFMFLNLLVLFFAYKRASVSKDTKPIISIN